MQYTYRNLPCNQSDPMSEALHREDARRAANAPSPNSSELNLGDTVILASDVGKTVAYNHMTVKQVNADGTVNLFRPYVATTDFKYTGKNPGDEQVITYIGTETLDNVDPKKLSLVAKCSKTIL